MYHYISLTIIYQRDMGMRIFFDNMNNDEIFQFIILEKTLKTA